MSEFIYYLMDHGTGKFEPYFSLSAVEAELSRLAVEEGYSEDDLKAEYTVIIGKELKVKAEYHQAISNIKIGATIEPATIDTSYQTSFL